MDTITIVRVWDAETGAVVGKPLDHANRVLFVAHSRFPEAVRTHIISGSGDGAYRIWDAKTSAEVSKSLLHADFLVHRQCTVRLRWLGPRLGGGANIWYPGLNTCRYPSAL